MGSVMHINGIHQKMPKINFASIATIKDILLIICAFNNCNLKTKFNLDF